MLNARHNKDKHNGPGLSGWMHSVSGAPSWLRFPASISPPPLDTGCAQCPLSASTRCNCSGLRLLRRSASALVCCAFVSCTCNMQHAACLSTCHNSNCPEAAASRWRVDFISINALLSYTPLPHAATQKETRLLHIAK